MSPGALQAIAKLHAVLAWAATAALFLTPWLSRVGRARQKTLGAAALALLVATCGLGLALHEPYRARLRQRLFIEAPSMGWLFERKLHAAFAAALLAAGAVATLVTLDRTAPGAPERRVLVRSAALSWGAAAGLALAASIASAIVARRAHF